MPVSTARNTALFPLTTNTPCTSSFLGSPGAGGGGAASVTLELPCFFAVLAASSKSLRVRTASAWIGIATTFLRSAVLILAVVDRPGRRFSGGFASVTTTLKSFASCVLVVVCVVVSPDLRHFAFENLSWHGVNGHVGLLAQFHVDDIRFVDLHFGRHHRHIREGHDEAARRVLHSHYDIVAYALRQIAHDPIDRRCVSRLV